MPPLNISSSALNVFSHHGLNHLSSLSSFSAHICRHHGIDNVLEDVSDDEDLLPELPSLIHRDCDSDSDDDSSSVSSSDTFDRLTEQLLPPPTDDTASLGDEDESIDDVGPKTRAPRQFGYAIGDFMKSHYYNKFLCPTVRERIYATSTNPKSSFHSRFRVPLHHVDALRSMFIERGWVRETRRVKGRRLYVRTQLLIMSSLEHLGGRKPFLQFQDDTEMCEAMHSNFFKDVFLVHLYSNKDEWICFPDTMEQLQTVMQDYTKRDLPGCGGSIDVVHTNNGQIVQQGTQSKQRGKRNFQR